MNKDFRKVTFINFQKWTFSRRLMDALRATQGENSFHNKDIFLKLDFVTFSANILKLKPVHALMWFSIFSEEDKKLWSGKHLDQIRALVAPTRSAIMESYHYFLTCSKKIFWGEWSPIFTFWDFLKIFFWGWVRFGKKS